MAGEQVHSILVPVKEGINIVTLLSNVEEKLNECLSMFYILTLLCFIGHTRSLVRSHVHTPLQPYVTLFVNIAVCTRAYPPPTLRHTICEHCTRVNNVSPTHHQPYSTPRTTSQQHIILWKVRTISTQFHMTTRIIRH